MILKTILKIIVVLAAWIAVSLMIAAWWSRMKREEKRLMKMYEKEEKDERSKTL